MSKTKHSRMEINVINKNTSVKGEIISDGDYRIDGNVEGELKVKGKVIIGLTGKVKGKVETANAEIEGTFSGDLVVHETLTIKSSASISGDIVISKLSVEPGAAFNASCQMKGAVKELNKNDQKGLSEQTA